MIRFSYFTFFSLLFPNALATITSGEYLEAFTGFTFIPDP